MRISDLDRILGPEPDDDLAGLSAAQIRARTPTPGNSDNLATLDVPALEALAGQIRVRASRSSGSDRRSLEAMVRQIEAEISRRTT